MSSLEINRQRLHRRIDEYLTQQVRRALKEDFALVEDIVQDYIKHYSLKQLIIILKVEAGKRKHKPLE